MPRTVYIAIASDCPDAAASLEAMKAEMGVGPDDHVVASSFDNEATAVTAQQEEWDRRLANGENLFFVTEEAMADELAKHSEQA